MNVDYITSNYIYPYTAAYRNDRLYQGGLRTTFGISTALVTAGVIYFEPTFLLLPAVITGISVSVTTLGGSSVTLGLYSDSGIGTPNTLIGNYGNILTTTTGIKTIGITPVYFYTPTIIWTANVSNFGAGSSPTYNVYANTTNLDGRRTSAQAQINLTSTSTTFPYILPDSSLARSTGANNPVVGLTIASL